MDGYSKGRIFCATATIVLSLLWAGMLLGISFLETPVKFLAPTITTAVALDVGRTVFHYFFIVQAGIMLLLAFAVFFARPSKVVWMLAGIVAASLLVQNIWLLPVLDARVTMVQSGIAIADLPKTSVHNFYAICEVLKLVGLFWLGIGGINQLRRS